MVRIQCLFTATFVVIHSSEWCTVLSGALAWCQEHDTGTPQLRPNSLSERICELLRCAWCRSDALANPTRPYTALQPPILAHNPAVARVRARSHRSRCSRRPVRKMMSM